MTFSMYFGISLLLNSSSILNHYLKLPAAAVAGICSSAVPIQPLLQGDAVVFFIVTVLFLPLVKNYSFKELLASIDSRCFRGCLNQGYFSKQMLTLVNCS